MYLLFKFVRIIHTKLHQGHMEIASRKEITMVTQYYPEISENFQGPVVTSLVKVNIVYWEPVGDIINI